MRYTFVKLFQTWIKFRRSCLIIILFLTLADFFDQLSETFCATLVEGILSNISVIVPVVQEISLKGIYIFCSGGQHSRTIRAILVVGIIGSFSVFCRLRL